MYRRIAIFILVGLFSWTNMASAEMSSTNFSIRWDAISTGGSDTSSSASYIMHDTVGMPVAGQSTSTTYTLQAGYRSREEVLELELYGQVRSSERTAFARVGNTIVCSPDELAVGDYIAVVQDVGVAPVVGVGRIESMTGVSVTVDTLQNTGVAPTIDGSNDVVYLLSGRGLNLGGLSEEELSSAVAGFWVTADLDNGYSVQVFEDDDLRHGANDINDVGDGAVTLGAEEYGGRSSDATLATSTFDTADTAFTQTGQDIATRAIATYQGRDFVVLKASIDGSTTDGVYGQLLSFIVSGNF